jgi:hypothetical protein
MSDLYVWFVKECRKNAARGGVSYGDRVRPIQVPPETVRRRVDERCSDRDTAIATLAALEERTEPQV